MSVDLNRISNYIESEQVHAAGADPLATGDSFLFEEPEVVGIGLLLPAVQKVREAAQPIDEEALPSGDQLASSRSDEEDRADTRDPSTTTDDVYIDGNIITAESSQSAYDLVGDTDSIWMDVGYPNGDPTTSPDDVSIDGLLIA